MSVPTEPAWPNWHMLYERRYMAAFRIKLELRLPGMRFFSFLTALSPSRMHVHTPDRISWGRPRLGWPKGWGHHIFFINARSDVELGGYDGGTVARVWSNFGIDVQAQLNLLVFNFTCRFQLLLILPIPRILLGEAFSVYLLLYWRLSSESPESFGCVKT